MDSLVQTVSEEARLIWAPEREILPSYYPVFLNLHGARCLVVGGGPVAERKVAALLECGADVTLVSPHANERLRQMAGLGRLSYVERGYEPADLDRMVLVILATNSHEINTAIAQQAALRHVLVNVVDDPSSCSFIVPAVLRRGDLTIAVSTGGRSPALARYARDEIEVSFPAGFEQVVDRVAALRQRVRERVADVDVRSRVWCAIMADSLIDLLRAGELDEAERRLERILADLESPAPPPDPDDA